MAILLMIVILELIMIKGEDHDDIKSNDNDSYNMKNKKIINLKMNV